jgi:hypothetical protein
MVGFRWEEEVEPFFQQLWNIPLHLTKPLWVQKGVSREKLSVRVRFPTKPPPPLPPDSPGLYFLGVEEEASVEVEVMADRGRGRGRGTGHGE